MGLGSTQYNCFQRLSSLARSGAYLDYVERYAEVSALLRVARSAKDARLASAAAKGAIVLAAAALERYVNDAIRQACARVKIARYELLSEAQQGYLCSQIARRLATFDRADGDYRSFDAARRESLRQALTDSLDAMADPSKWQHSPDFGLFMDGAAAPTKIASVLRDFDPSSQDIFAPLDQRPLGRGAVLRSLSQLVDARHDAAHAKTLAMPSPTDAQGWAVAAFWVARLIETFLAKASPI